MADLVNPVSAAQLKPRNSEPTHLGGTSWDDIGGTAMNAEPNTAKVDAAASVKTDTSIPHSVTAEPSHLTGMAKEEDETPEVEFDDEDEMELDEADDLDKALDEMADEKPIDVKINESDDEDEDDMKEEDEDGKEDMKEEDDKEDDLKEETHEDDKEEMKEEEDDEKKDVAESLRIKIALPKTSLFESAGFSEKQQKQVAAIFESAIKDTTKQVSVKLNEHYKTRYAQKAQLAEKKLVERLNSYLSVVVESWLDANKMAVRQSLRADLSENFLTGLQTLFREHYIDVPESKVNVVETLQKEVERLKEQINEQSATNLKMRRLAEAANKKRIVAEFARNMSEVQAAKLAKLAENTEYVDAKDFREKLTMLKESYFSEKGERKITRLPEEDVKVVKEETGTKSEADLVAEAITRQVKSAW